MAETKDFEEWWERDGRLYDPDFQDVPGPAKIKGIAEYAFNAGRAKQ